MNGVDGQVRMRFRRREPMDGVESQEFYPGPDQSVFEAFSHLLRNSRSQAPVAHVFGELHDYPGAAN